MSKLSNSLFLPAFIQTKLLQIMQLGIIANIKVPNAFVFNIEEITELKEVPKDSSFCKVKLFKYKGEKCALKIISKKEIPNNRFEEEYKRVANQIKLLYELKHPYVIKLFYHDETPDQIRLLMEYGGTRLSSHFKETYRNEDEVRRITKQILQVLKYVHEEGYIHRDLQPSNILLNKQAQTIKLVDFGFVDEVAFRRTKIGSYHYMAPEVTGENTYNQKVDIWSLGIIVYQMLHKQIPFCSRKQFDVQVFQQNKQKLDIKFDSEISQVAKKFIKRMLVIDPENRANASQLLKHEFIEPEEDLSSFDRQGTEKKTHKYQYVREVSGAKQQETIQELQGRLKRTMSELFTCFHHQKETLSSTLQTYRQLLTHSIQQKQKRLN